MATQPGLGQDKAISQEHLPGLSHGAGAQAPTSTAFAGHQQGAGLEGKQTGLELVTTWNASIAGGSST